jgi:branched-chain amino acid transport system ATP-binding protein
MLGLPRQRREERESSERAYELLHRVGLERRANDIAGSLAYGEQRRLEIARALGTSPGVILLDEPAAGTNPAEKRELATLIQGINVEDGISVLLIEHDMKLVMSIAHRIVVLNFGQKIAEGTPEQIQRNPEVIAAYLGTPADEVADMDLSQPELHRIDTDVSLDELVGQTPTEQAAESSGSAEHAKSTGAAESTGRAGATELHDRGELPR